ncbi:hypothetical protein RJ641_001252 [Dillenia turbinata]|uniref:Uncharacterized protein n=1 Tax=Dillenia turbinata TaxID=194707 RepID=A0AAN8WDF4_9MAGN
MYELRAADLVVGHLDELSVVDLKNLADIELSEIGSPEPEPEMEEEEDCRHTSTLDSVDDASFLQRLVATANGLLEYTGWQKSVCACRFQAGRENDGLCGFYTWAILKRHCMSTYGV